MPNLRDQQRSDLAFIRDDWWIPIVLIGPDKTRYEVEFGTTNPLLGDVRKESKDFDPELGGIVVTKKTSITIRIEDLEVVPKEEERWFVEYPDTLLDSGVVVTAPFTPNNVDVGGDSLGYIKIFPQAEIA